MTDEKVIIDANKAKNVLEMIDSYCFPKEITETAKKYYLERKAARKEGKSDGWRQNLAFACIYQAHLILKVPFSVAKLAQSMGIKIKTVGTIITKYILFGFEPTIVRYTAFDFLEMYSNYAGLPDDKYEAVAKIARRVYEKDPSLYDVSPQKVAAAVINHFYELNGHKTEAPLYDTELFLTWTEIKRGAFKSYTEYIKKIYESNV